MAGPAPFESLRERRAAPAPLMRSGEHRMVLQKRDNLGEGILHSDARQQSTDFTLEGVRGSWP